MWGGVNGSRYQHDVICPVSLLFEDQSNSLSNEAFVPVWNVTLHIHPSMAVTLSGRVKRPFSVHVHCRLSVSGCCCFFLLLGHNMWYKNPGKMKNIYTTTLSVTADQVRIKFVLFFFFSFSFLLTTILSHSPFPLLNFSLLTSSLNTAAKIWDTKREWDRKVKQKRYK